MGNVRIVVTAEEAAAVRAMREVDKSVQGVGQSLEGLRGKSLGSMIGISAAPQIQSQLAGVAASADALAGSLDRTTASYARLQYAMRTAVPSGLPMAERVMGGYGGGAPMAGAMAPAAVAMPGYLPVRIPPEELRSLTAAGKTARERGGYVPIVEPAPVKITSWAEMPLGERDVLARMYEESKAATVGGLAPLKGELAKVGSQVEGTAGKFAIFEKNLVSGTGGMKAYVTQLERIGVSAASLMGMPGMAMTGIMGMAGPIGLVAGVGIGAMKVAGMTEAEKERRAQRIEETKMATYPLAVLAGPEAAAARAEALDIVSKYGFGAETANRFGIAAWTAYPSAVGGGPGQARTDTDNAAVRAEMLEVMASLKQRGVGEEAVLAFAETTRMSGVAPRLAAAQIEAEARGARVNLGEYMGYAPEKRGWQDKGLGGAVFRGLGPLPGETPQFTNPERASMMGEIGRQLNNKESEFATKMRNRMKQTLQADWDTMDETMKLNAMAQTISPQEMETASKRLWKIPKETAKAFSVLMQHMGVAWQAANEAAVVKPEDFETTTRAAAKADPMGEAARVMSAHKARMERIEQERQSSSRYMAEKMVEDAAVEEYARTHGDWATWSRVNAETKEWRWYEKAIRGLGNAAEDFLKGVTRTIDRATGETTHLMEGWEIIDRDWNARMDANVAKMTEFRMGELRALEADQAAGLGGSTGLYGPKKEKRQEIPQVQEQLGYAPGIRTEQGERAGPLDRFGRPIFLAGGEGRPMRGPMDRFGRPFFLFDRIPEPESGLTAAGLPRETALSRSLFAAAARGSPVEPAVSIEGTSARADSGVQENTAAVKANTDAALMLRVAIMGLVGGPAAAGGEIGRALRASPASYEPRALPGRNAQI